MTNTIVTTTDVEEILGRSLTSTELPRVELDLDSIVEMLGNWAGMPLVPKVVTDERHVVVHEWERLHFNYRPVASVQGVRLDEITNPLVDNWNKYWEEPDFYRGSVYFVSYTTDASKAEAHYLTIKRAAVYAAIRGLLSGDAVRSGLISSYSVEGTSITYNTNTNDQNAKGPIPGTDISALATLRRGVKVW